MARYTRRDRAAQLLKTASRGPAFDEDNEAAFRMYRIWSTTWLLPELKKLIPELKDVELPPCGTSKIDPFWSDRTFAGNGNAGSQ